MKNVVLTFLILIQTGNAHAGSSCPKLKQDNLPKACKTEIDKAIENDSVSNDMEMVLINSLHLSQCSKSPENLNFEYVEDDAVGNHLKISAMADCQDSSSGFAGYTIKGYYFLDERDPLFQFTGIDVIEVAE